MEKKLRLWILGLITTLSLCGGLPAYAMSAATEGEEPVYTVCDTIQWTWTAEAGVEKTFVFLSWMQWTDDGYYYGRFIVDWGDGFADTVDPGQNSQIKINHAYVSAGAYTVVFRGEDIESRIRECSVVRSGLTSLDVKCPALAELNCSGNQLEVLDMTQNADLSYLACNENRLTLLDVTQNAALTTLYCGSNLLEALDLTGCPALDQLYCDDNRLTALNVSQNTALRILECRYNRMPFMAVAAVSRQMAAKENARRYRCYPQHTEPIVSPDLAAGIDLASYRYTIDGVESRMDFFNRVTGDTLKAEVDYRLADGKVYFTESGKYRMTVQHVAVKERNENDGLYAYKESRRIDAGDLPVYDTKDTVRLAWEVDGVQDAYLRGDGLFTIDWGDGQTQSIELNSLYLSQVAHVYGAGGDYEVVIGSEEGRIYNIECANRAVKTLDVTRCPELVELRCHGNALTALDVSKNTALRTLISNGNPLSAIDISKNTALTLLSCDDNQLTGLDVSNNLKLEKLYCNQNSLTALDVSKNTALTLLSCDDNQLTALDVSNNLKLEKLYCNQNSLTALDVSKNTALQSLYCYENQLTALDVSKNTALTNLNFYGNRVAEIDLSQNPALVELGCSYNLLSALDLSACVNLNWMNCSDNQLTSLDVRGCAALQTLYCYKNALTALEVSNSTALTNLNFYSNQIESIDLSQNPALVELGCSYNLLSALDLSACVNLNWMNCSDNQLTSLDVRGCTVLQKLYCSENQLTSLDISRNEALQILNVDNNRLAALDLTRNLMLEAMSCAGNRLTALDVSENTGLTELSVINNRLPFGEVAALIELMAERQATVYAFYPQSMVSWTLAEEEGVPLAGCRYEMDGVASELYLVNPDGDTVSVTADLSTADYRVSGDSLYFSRSGLYRLVASHHSVMEKYEAYDEEQGEYIYLSRVYTGLFEISVGAVAYDTINLSWTAEAGMEKRLALVGASEGRVLIDWGDGTAPEWYGVSETVGYMTHGYATGGTYAVSLYSNRRIDRFGCDSSAVKTLDVTRCPALVGLWCRGNALTVLDVSKNTALQVLYCYENQLTALDVSKNPALTNLNFYSNQIESIDLSQNPALVELGCSYNRLSALDVRSNPNIAWMNCSGNLLTALEVSNNTALQTLYCYENALTALDVSKTPALQTLYCYKNALTALDVSNSTALTNLNFYSNQIASIDLSQNPALVELGCSYNRLSALDVRSNPNIAWMNCRGNALTALDVTKNMALTTLNCGGNQLTSLDVAQNLLLETLYCDSNRLAVLDISENTALQGLVCAANELVALDLSANTVLDGLICMDNRLPFTEVAAIVKLLASRNLEQYELSPQRSDTVGLDLQAAMSVASYIPTLYGVKSQMRLFNAAGDTLVAEIGYRLVGDSLYFNEIGTYRLSVWHDSVMERIYDFEAERSEPSIYVADYAIVVTGETVNLDTLGVEWTWQVTAWEDRQLEVTVTGKGFSVDWGDGRTGEVTADAQALEHRYAKDGEFTVKLVPLGTNSYVTDLKVANLRLETLRFGDASMLKTLDCSGNYLTELELEDAPALVSLNCADNAFETLDLTPYAQLMDADVSGNRLQALSLPTHDNLKSVKGDNNRLRLPVLHALLSQRAPSASYRFDPQVDSAKVPVADALDLSAEMSIGGGQTTYALLSLLTGQAVDTSAYIEDQGQFFFRQGGRYLLRLGNENVMEYADGQAADPITFVWYITVGNEANEAGLYRSQPFAYVQGRTIYLTEDLGEVDVFTSVGQRVYRGRSLEIEVPHAGVYVLRSVTDGRRCKVMVK